jgi:hypothetical protein
MRSPEKGVTARALGVSGNSWVGKVAGIRVA